MYQPGDTQRLPAARPAPEAPDRGAPSPGLLRVLRQAAALRFGLISLGWLTFLAARMSGHIPSLIADWLPWVLMAEAGGFLAFVLWAAPRGGAPAAGRFDRAFLPVALTWFLTSPLLEQGLVLRVAPLALLNAVGGSRLAGIGFEGLFVVIPVILATWQYGRRGLAASLTVLSIGQILLTPLIATTAVDVAFYLLSSVGRTAMIALLGYVILQLVTALRADHQRLAAANRQLAQRAATAEQLAESRERNRLARELHDTLAHSLTGLSVQLKALETLLVHDPARAHVQLLETQGTVRTGLQEVRRAIQALRATPLEDLGLAEALRQLCTRLSERSAAVVRHDIADLPSLDPLTEQTIYRIAETALANVEQHAGATTITVRLKPAPDGRLQLEVTDDGVGFDPASVPDNRFGLAGMAERAQLIGAAFHIEATPGKGARVLLETL